MRTLPCAVAASVIFAAAASSAPAAEKRAPAVNKAVGHQASRAHTAVRTRAAARVLSGLRFNLTNATAAMSTSAMLGERVGGLAQAQQDGSILAHLVSIIDEAASAPAPATLTTINMTGPDRDISAISNALQQLSTNRTNIVAIEGRISNSITALKNVAANEHQVQPTEMAAGSSGFASNQIRVQAGSTVLGNANRTQSLIGALLGG